MSSVTGDYQILYLNEIIMFDDVHTDNITFVTLNRPLSLQGLD